MANFYADEINLLQNPAYGQPLTNRMPASLYHGRIRYAEWNFVAPTSGTAPAIGDKVIFGKLPVGVRVIPDLSYLHNNAGTASCTINVGDQFLATRYSTALAINATPAKTALAGPIGIQTSLADDTVGSNQLTLVKSIGAYKIGALVSGTGITTGTTVTAIDVSSKIVTMSAAATSSNSQTTVTVSGSSYVTTDDSSNANNAWASATDDCTIIGTVAGAQIANNQILLLKLAFVHD